MRVAHSSRLLPALLVAAAASAQDAAAPDYGRDVRPILADRCFRCHGPDAGARRAELRLDLRDIAVAPREHGAAIVPGAPDRSEVWRRVTSDDPDERMPPPDSGRKQLTPRERELVRAWLEGGAVYEPHWSFVPPVRPPLPPVRDASWVRTPVDAFVLALLERHGLEPSPVADDATLVRRLFLTLTGLPPEPHELAAFARDGSSGAWDRLVDRLLDEEPYRSRLAERMATPWLDAARYADTCGIHMDNGRQMWAWRDWVLAAFRDNMPFDRFVQEQVAGDLMPDATLQQKVASGFHRNHVTTDEGGAIADEYLVEYAVDRAATTGSVFLGLTVGCARCHDHKFDPISQQEFYGLFAFFRSIDEPGLYSQEDDSNRAFEPFLRVPTPEQQQRQQQLESGLAEARAAMAAPAPEEDAAMAAWQRSLLEQSGVRWADSRVEAATSLGGAAMTVQADGSVLCSGSNPDKDHHEIRLRTEATDLRLLCLEALTDPSHFEGKVGRAANGNAVLMAIDVEAVSVTDPTRRQKVPLVWAWASLEQDNGDYAVVNALASDDGVGWAVAAHQQPPGPRVALFLADAPFGYAGGTELAVTLHYDSIHGQHAFGRVRLCVGALGDQGAARLPEAHSGWYVAGPFAGADGEAVWADADGPEAATHFDRSQRFANAAATGDRPARRWRHEPDFKDGRVNELQKGTNRSYVGRRVFAPTPRARELSLGSDDGFRLYLDGKEVAGRRVDRSIAPDQDRATVELPAGEHLLTLKVVNTGGEAAFYLQPQRRDDELDGPLVAALLPAPAQAHLQAELRVAWRLRFSPAYAAAQARTVSLEKEVAELDKTVARTMVMRELAKPRPTFVLTRGEYDKPDKARPVQPSVPAALGAMPADAPRNRLGLAQWLVAADNPLLSRVQVNRLWELVFGTGIVRTSEDLGMQGEWPSHRELLDWLAVEFRASGFDLRQVLRLLAKSATFRQQNRVRDDAQALDPDNRWLAFFPRRRLSAEALRDQALYVSGLLVERLGGPSVKPYQPSGIWREVAMPNSNTKIYDRGDGDALFRRSLYTYYKRASPPPSMLTFDAPSREFCTVRRMATNTPLQALVLWNDEQFVEAARALAQRACDDAPDDAGRLTAMVVRCTGRSPSAAMLQRLQQALLGFRARFLAAPDDARALLAVGTVPPRPDLAAPELAALAMVASAVLNLDATLCTP